MRAGAALRGPRLLPRVRHLWTPPSRAKGHRNFGYGKVGGSAQNSVDEPVISVLHTVCFQVNFDYCKVVRFPRNTVGYGTGASTTASSSAAR